MPRSASSQGAPAPFVAVLVALVVLQALLIVFVVLRAPPPVSVVQRPADCLPIARGPLDDCLRPLRGRSA